MQRKTVNKFLLTALLLVSSSCRHSRREMAMRELIVENSFNKGSASHSQAEVVTDIGDEELSKLANGLNCTAKRDHLELCDLIFQFLNGRSFSINSVKDREFLIGKFWDMDRNHKPLGTGYETLKLSIEHGIQLAKNFGIKAHNLDEREAIKALIVSQAADTQVPKNAASEFILNAKQSRSIVKILGKSLTYYNKGKVYLRANGPNLIMLCQMEGIFLAVFPNAINPNAR